jgi:diguanylate cyclase (GGDEF)-like protein
MPMTPLDPTEDLHALRLSFIASMWRGLSVVALLAIPITAWRSAATGWLPLYGVHLALATLVLLVAWLQPRLGLGLRAGAMAALLWLVGLPGLLAFGLQASGVWWLVLGSLVAGILHSIRAGIAMAAATGLAMAVTAHGYVTGWLVPAIEPAVYMGLKSSWVAIMLVTAIFFFMVLRIFGDYVRATERLAQRIAEQRDEIGRLSMHDPLTGLPLARLAEDRIEMAMYAARRADRRVAVLYIDLDGFKAVNDRFGHDAGDYVLRECARRMADVLRREDTLARVGGDEFIAVIGGLDEPGSAEVVAAKLAAEAAAPFWHEGVALGIGASVGIALFPDHAHDARTLRKLADQAMYEAKRRGKATLAQAQAGDPAQSEASSLAAMPE